MAEKTLRVPSNEQPTFWNRTIGFGAAIGSLILSWPGAIVGSIIGGFMGKNRMEKEAEVGKDVSPPTFWNRSVINWAAIANVVATVAVVAAFGSVGKAVSSMGMGGVAAIGLGAMTLGGIVGGNIGKARMEHEYKEAEAYVTRHGEYKGKAMENALAMAKAIAPQQSYTVSPEEAHLLETRLAAVEARQSHADRAREAGLAPQQPTTPT